MVGSGGQRGKAGGGVWPPEKDDVLTRQFLVAEQHATATLAGWVGAPPVREIIERHKSEANTAVAPIERHITSQKEVARFCWHVYGFGGLGPDWGLRRDAPWLLTPIEVKLMPFVITWFRRVVQATISELENAGVAVKPTWAGDHAAVGEMLLLDVDWNLPAADLAANMNPPGPGALLPEASGTLTRRGAGERVETNLTAIRRRWEYHLDGPRRRAPYAGGGKRDDRSTTAKRREMVAKVLEKFPDAAASKMFTDYRNYTRLSGGQAGSAGGYLRQLLEAAAEPGEIVNCPAKETLRQDLIALRARENQEKDQVKPSEDSPGHPA